VPDDKRGVMTGTPGEIAVPPPGLQEIQSPVGAIGNRFCWEVMHCDNLRCPVRQRQIIRCFGFYGSRPAEEKQRLCGCQRSCDECHYKRGWDLGMLHEGLFEDLLEERRRKMARVNSLQQRGIVEIYLQELARKPLTRSEEMTLAKRLAGDRKASELLLTANLKLVVRISSQFTNRGLSLMDLIQEGNLGLIKAVSKFDWRLGYKFSTYAAYWIRHYMQRAVSNQGRVLRVPHHLLMVAHKIKRAISEFQGQWQRAPNLTELAGLVGLEEDKVLDIIRITETPISIEARQPDGDDEESSLEYFLADKNRLTPKRRCSRKPRRKPARPHLKHCPTACAKWSNASTAFVKRK
ncbi:MAG TPA: sigma-70 family RNA polymerase sigma factor, partial [Candidatus Ozemobacteraceae bacterium]|nr:sigma-70 family RNA polymerase sigma factor [Candidatus Ozemobacteraceae bacterium]